MKDEVAKEPVDVSSAEGEMRPAVFLLKTNARVDLHAQRDGEDKDANAGEKPGEEGVEGKPANGDGVGKLDDAR